MRNTAHTGPRPTVLAQVSISDERSRGWFAQLAAALEELGVDLCTLEMHHAATREPRREGCRVRLPNSAMRAACERWCRIHSAPQDAGDVPAGAGVEDLLATARRFEADLLRIAGKEPDEGGILARQWWYLRAWDVLLQCVRPRAVLVQNGGAIWEATLAAAARRPGLPVLYVERGPLPDTLQVDPQGVNGGAAFARAAFVQEPAPLSAAEREELGAYVEWVRGCGASAWEQPEAESAHSLRRRLAIPEGARVLFFPGQVTGDTNVLLNCPNFAGNADVVAFLAELVRQRPHWHLVVKPHPKAVDPLEEPADGVDGRFVLCPDAHVHALIEMADLVATINSSVGCEAALMGKPVVQLGRSLLSGKGVVYEPSGREEAARRLGELMDGEPAPAASERRRDAFFHHFLFEFLYRFDELAEGRGAARLARRVVNLAAGHRFPAQPEAAYGAMTELLAARMDYRKVLSRHSDGAILEAFYKRALITHCPDGLVRQEFARRGLVHRLGIRELLGGLRTRLRERLLGARAKEAS